mgnify:FL=1
MKEYPVGATVTLRIIPTEADTCKGCFFDELQRNIYDVNCCTDIKCRHYERKDGKDVIYVIDN